MALSVFFNAADKFRVVADTVNVGDDLDPRVLFSPDWQGALVEYHEYGVGGDSSNVWVPFSMSFARPPIVISGFLASGQFYSPYSKMYYTINTGETAALQQVFVHVLTNGLTFSVAGYGGGTFKAYVMGN
jgi:hypothetical protein